MKLRIFAVSVTALKGGASGVIVPPGGFVVSLISGVKPQTCMVSVSAHKGSADPKSEQQQDLLRRTNLPQCRRGPEQDAAAVSHGQLLFFYLVQPTSC